MGPVRPGVTAASIAMAVIFWLCAISPAFAAAVGHFTVVQGRVDILKPGQTRAVEAHLDDPVYLGDILRSKSASFAEVSFNDGTVLRLARNTRVEIKDFSVSAAGRREAGSLRLIRGKIRAIVPRTFGSIIPVSSARSTFEVETPTAVAGVRGTDFIVWYNLGVTYLYVLDGIVDSYHKLLPGAPRRVSAGMFTAIGKDGDPAEPSFISDADLEMQERETSGAGASSGAEPEGMAQADQGAPSGADLPLSGVDGLGAAVFDIPVTETHTALLGGDSGTFTGPMSGASSLGYLTLSGTMTGDYTSSQTWSAQITGTFTDLLQGSLQSWTGTVSGTVSDGGTFSASLLSGSWDGLTGTWSATLSGTQPTGAFSGTVSGTSSGGPSGTITGSGSGTWQQ